MWPLFMSFCKLTEVNMLYWVAFQKTPKQQAKLYFGLCLKSIHTFNLLVSSR